MNTCETCQHWKDDWRIPAKECDLDGWNWCDMAENKYDEQTPHPESLAVAEDREKYCASLRTFKTFGCTQHKPKV